ncbi:MAG: hypothetical protein KatS3mg113_0734 [Planctomycetaceae bacterium]|nr:MAG: hypothetical protein KatS3mg113_0734 [Planctomycetaceae bacterium]
MSMQEVAPATVVGKIPSGLFVLTARHPFSGQTTGMLISWVQQASFEPLMITFALKRDRYLNLWLQDTPTVGLNLLGEGQKHLLMHFGKGFPPDQPAFEGLTIEVVPPGVPCITEALGFLLASIRGQCAAGDHVLYLAEVHGARVGAGWTEAEPWVHLRRSGDHY